MVGRAERLGAWGVGGLVGGRSGGLLGELAGGWAAGWVVGGSVSPWVGGAWGPRA